MRRSGEMISLRLDKGEDILSSLAKVCEEAKVRSALVSGIGACRLAEVSHYDTAEKRYHGKTYEGMLEVLSLSGNITSDDGKPLPHLHIILGLKDFSAVGGHLGRSEVDPTCEIKILMCGTPIIRKKDEGTGLKLQSFL
jgi:predicted DNA-binding protein with PD1-like motif